MQRHLIGRKGVGLLDERESHGTTVHDVEAGCRDKMSKEDLLFDELDALKQGERTLMEYVRCTEDILKRAPARWERYIVDSFVEGMVDDEQRELVADALNEDGYAWERVSEIVQNIEGRRKRKRRKRYIVRPEDMEAYMNVTP